VRAGFVPAAASVPAGHQLGMVISPGRSSAGHLGPGEVGELAGHRGDRDGSGLAAGGHRLVAGVQPALRLPGAGQGIRGRVVLAAAQGDADRGLEPVGPGRLDQRRAGGGRARLGDRAAAGRRWSTRRAPAR
jgi:hypothetical protein